jgi:hypothetical protein
MRNPMAEVCKGREPFLTSPQGVLVHTDGRSSARKDLCAGGADPRLTRAPTAIPKVGAEVLGSERLESTYRGMERIDIPPAGP